MRRLFKPLLLLTAAVNLLLVALLASQGGTGSTIASELLPGTSSYQINDLLLTQRVATLVDHQYVDPERVDPERMFERALEQVQRGVPELMFDQDASAHAVTIHVDDFSQRVVVGPMASVPDVVNGLRAVLGVVGEHWTGKADALQEVEYSAINGMLSTLDPHSILLPPDNAKAMDVQIQGQFGGLGITISLRGDEQTLTVVSVLPETPAMRAGIKAGDEIVQIDGESTVNVDLNEAVDKLRGPVGSKVEILVDRKTFDEPQVFKIRRDLIRINSIETADLGDGYGLIKLKSFQHNTYQQLLEGLSALQANGPIKGIVLDLRHNPGGPLQQAVDVADRFIDQGDLVTTVQSHSREKEVKRAHRNGTEPPYPMVVILDSDSASASEIVAGALKNNDRAVVIGETSFGKGSVQNLFQNPDDSKLKLTMLQYLTPGDQSIQSVGITPDVRLTPVYFDEELVYMYSTAHIFRERDLEEHLDSDPRDQVEQDPPVATLRYYAPEEFRLPSKEEKTPQEEPSAAPVETEPDPLTDFQIRFARDLLVNAGRATRKATLAQANGYLATRTTAAEQELVDQMKRLGIDWTDGSAGAGPVDVQVAFDRDATSLEAGAEVNVQVTVANQGDKPLTQTRVITSSDLGLFDQLEFLYGRVDPGQSRTWSRKVKLPSSLMSLAEPVSFEVWQGDRAKITERREVVQVREKAKPAFAWTVVPIDDGSGTSRGNGDGLIQRGEAIDLLLLVGNLGEGPSERAFFKISNEEGRHVYLHSGTVNFDAIAPGDTVARRLSFEVRDTLPGDSITFTLRNGDAQLLAQPSSELHLPVAPAAVVAPTATTRVVKVGGDALARATPALDAPTVASLTPGALITVDATLGDWSRVHLPLAGETVPVWLPNDDLSNSRSAAPETIAARPAFTQSPPRIDLKPAAYEVAQATTRLRVTGLVKDDHAVRKVYAFVNGKKRYFESVPAGSKPAGPGGVSVPLSFDLPLESGANMVEIYAHDDEDVKASAFFQVWREPALQAAAKE